MMKQSAVIRGPWTEMSWKKLIQGLLVLGFLTGHGSRGVKLSMEYMFSELPQIADIVWAAGGPRTA